MGVPVRDGRVLGNFCAMDKVVRNWTPSDIEALSTLALAAGGEVALRLALRAAEHHADEAQELAEILQESLIPAQAPRLAGVQFGVRFRSGGSGGEVMGDFYAGAWGVTLAGGGHPPAFVLRAGGGVEQLDGGGRLLGIAANCPIHQQSVCLAVGDSIVLYTDGITEARPPGGGRLFEESGIAAVLRAVAPGADADTIAGAVADAAYAYAGGHVADDSGVVVVRIVTP
jgi:sigma-B regulation protein RsbU (phosphoserine phosphatase)